MLRRLALRHENHYSYSSEVERSHMYLCLKPRRSCSQEPDAFKIDVEPRGNLFHTVDGLGNFRHVLLVSRPHSNLSIISTAEVILAETPRESPGRPRLGEDGWESPGIALLAVMKRDSELTRPSEELDRFLGEASLKPASSARETAQRLESGLHELMDYVPGSTTVQSTARELLVTRKGVCQDFTHLSLAILRHWGMPCRYVSGYVWNPVCERNSPLASHAWAEVWDADARRWEPLDATNPASSKSAYITVAYGRDYNDVAPTRGVHSGFANARLDVRVDIGELSENAP